MNKLIFLTMLLLLSTALYSQNRNPKNQDREHDTELKSLDSLLTLNESEPQLLIKRGLYLVKKYQYSQALQSFEKAYLQDPNNSVLLTELAEVNNSLGNFHQALPYLQLLYSRDSSNSVNAIQLAKAYFNIRKYQEPYELLNANYQRDSSNLYLTKQLAFAALKSGHDSLAIELYAKIIPNNPNDINNYLNLASLYQRNNGYPEAIKTFENGIDVFPEETLLITKMADLHYAKRNYAKAIVPYEKILSMGDSIPDVIKNLGISYYYEKEYNKSLSLLDKSLMIKPNDPIAGLFLGLCYKNLNQPEESIAYLNFASKIALPYYLSDIYNQLGNVYLEKKSYKKSVEFLKKAYRLDSTKYDVLFKIANTYDVWQKDKSQALRYYNYFLNSKIEQSDNNEQLIKYATERKQKIKR